METKTLPAGTTEYKGYKIFEVFKYDSGKSDWEVFSPDGDYGYMMPYVSIDIVHSDIDEKLSENE